MRRFFQLILLSVVWLPLAGAQTASNSAGTVKQTGIGSAAITQKLDSQVVLALKKHRGEPTTLQADIPFRAGDDVLLDLEATVSDDLLKQITAAGGRITHSPDSNHIVRAMIPLAQVEALAGRADVKSIVPAQPTVTTRIIAIPPPPTNDPNPKP